MTPTQPEPVSPPPAQPPLGLDELARQARRKAEKQRAERHAAGRKRRFSRFRLALWAVELALVLAVVEFAVRQRLGGAAAPAAVVVHEEGMTPAPVLGEAALVLAGLREVPDARLASVARLAVGSEAMRNAQAQYARDYGLPVELENSIGMRFRLVPSGSSMIGSPEDEPGRGSVEKQHVRTVYRPFYLGKFEVTQAEYSRVMGVNPSSFRGPRRPVEEVSWLDAQKFCIRLNELEGLPKNTYRLPTEVEWEYACRAGTDTAYYSGSTVADLVRVAETGETNYRSTVNVGGRPPNALGLYNMHGNVWEWCLDWYSRYPGDATPITDDERRMRCLRGGNWYVRAPDCRSAERGRLAPTSHGNMLGFRVLRSIPELPVERFPVPNVIPEHDLLFFE